MDSSEDEEESISESNGVEVLEQIYQQIPNETDCYGKMKWIRGEILHARELVAIQGRDRSYVKVRFSKDKQSI